MMIINKNDLFLLEETVKRNFAAKYKDSVLGIFWSILKPLLIMILLTIIFSTLFGSRIENYPVYFLSGKCVYDFFSAATNSSINAIKNNGNILIKTAAPKHIFVLGCIISEFINFFITLVILIAVMIATNATFHFNTIPLAAIPIFAEFILLTGLGLILSIVCVYYRDMAHLWSVITVLLTYASALFYPMDIIPEPYHQYLILNPIFWAIDQFRHFVIWGTIPNILNIINLLLISAITLIIGMIIFKKYEKHVAMKF